MTRLERPAAAPCVLVIPAFNEERHIGRVLDGLAELALPLEVIVVDDGSRDRTSEIARLHGAHVISHPFNLGYGAALQTGYKYALRRKACLVVQMDADGQHDPRDIVRLVQRIERGECDLALGSRFLEPTDYRMSLFHRAGRQVFRAFARFSGLKVTDPTSGFQAMSREVPELYATDFYPTDYPDVDVLLVAHRYGLRIGESTVHMSTGFRASSLHGGLKSLYYVYRTMLSIWAAGAVRRRKATS